MQMQVGCRFKNLKTGKVKDVWITKRQYENPNFKYCEFNGWKQVGYEVKEFEGNK